MKLLARFFGRTPVRIEPLKPTHAAHVSVLHGTSFAHGWDQPEVARMLGDRGILADGLFAQSSQMPFGFVMSRLAADEAEILTICLDPAWRGQGHGHLLLERHQAHLVSRGVSKLFLEVEEGNAVALKLYLSVGFSKVGERPGYYRKSDGSRALALILRRDLG